MTDIKGMTRLACSGAAFKACVIVLWSFFMLDKNTNSYRSYRRHEVGHSLTSNDSMTLETVMSTASPPHTGATVRVDVCLNH